MEYNLAKQLKNAGFPGSESWKLIDYTNVFIPKSELDFTFPTLSELIEACGDTPMQLMRKSTWHNGSWVALAPGDIKELTLKNISESYIQKEGSTPQEAVAQLWLLLNRKKND